MGNADIDDQVDALTQFHINAGNETIESTETWHIQTGSRYSVYNINVKGELRVDGTLYVFGSLSGSGNVTGSGTVTMVN